jgi:hypothetical protein
MRAVPVLIVFALLSIALLSGDDGENGISGASHDHIQVRQAGFDNDAV